MELVAPAVFIAVGCYLFIKAEEPVTLFAFSKAYFVTFFNAARALVSLFFSDLVFFFKSLTAWWNGYGRLSHET